ncbi:hypothetical protein IW15_01430 [Chryseobacterium soli]|uniref:Thioredoxin domain-containing protein n=1 Tax=Chryseobacterium soli TaxID=445961 RepID=A0A086ABS0_9FLAO|nr:hypothetical protein [Chryseobacterium soli]KFF14134.1 hypothetical protein IW15_01430 [Chryseobacterium soli]
MKKISIIPFLFFAMFCFSQKKTIYYNEAMTKISKEYFENQLDNTRNLHLAFESDSLITNVLVKRKNYGKLSEPVFKQLKKSLSETNSFDKNLIIIMYYPGEDPCNHREENSRRGFHVRPYLKKLKKINSYEHFWVYKSYGQLQYYHPDEINWQPDKEQTLEKLFFNYHYPCSSFVVLDKEGNYICYYGESGLDKVFEFSKELTKKRLSSHFK